MKTANLDEHESIPAATLVDIDEKIDKILKYQKTARWLAIFRGFISFIFFLVFIVLPIIGSFYLFKFLQNVDFSKISGQYKEFYETMEQLKENVGQVGSLDELMNKLPGNGAE